MTYNIANEGKMLTWVGNIFEFLVSHEENAIRFLLCYFEKLINNPSISKEDFFKILIRALYAIFSNFLTVPLKDVLPSNDIALTKLKAFELVNRISLKKLENFSYKDI